MGWQRFTVPRKAGDLVFDSWKCVEEWTEDLLLATIVEE